ncbi:MAG: galactokinase [Lachnospiraceae bacterium]|nr:galactokinase [Lachnospiraceae bacterium]
MLEEGRMAERFTQLYGGAEAVPDQTARYLKLLKRFEEKFGAGELKIYSAPGRSEIAGNHTDHQHGEVLAASIDLDAVGFVRPLQEDTVTVISGDYPPVRINIKELEQKKEEEGTTAGLIRGVLAGFVKHGYRIGAFQTCIDSRVLIGAGLSSSAAFETLLGSILSGLYNEGKVSSTEIAIIGQYAENVYFGKPCGLLDQMACSTGGMIYIDFEKPSQPLVKKIDFDFSAAGYLLCITDTKGSHADLTDDYAAVPAEMKSVAAYFGKEVLREVPEEDVIKKIPELRKACGDRAVLRALHFYCENARVRSDFEALEQKNMETFLKGVQESGDSSFKYLQNVYTNKDVQSQNVSLALCLAERVLKGRGACRVHGGGFAGTTQAWVPKDLVPEYKSTLDAVFGEGACAVLCIRSCGGTELI